MKREMKGMIQFTAALFVCGPGLIEEFLRYSEKRNSVLSHNFWVTVSDQKSSHPEKKSIMSMAGDSPDKEKDAAPQKNYYKGSTEVATETPLTLTRLETVSRPKRTIFSSCC